MRKHISKKWLKSLNPCSNGYEYWLKQNKPYLPDFLRQCLKDDHFNWANWLIVRCLDKKGSNDMAYLQQSRFCIFLKNSGRMTIDQERQLKQLKIVIKRDHKKEPY